MPARSRLRAVPDSPSRAGLYVRVSDVHGRAGERFFSPDTQLDSMRALCQRQGWTPVETWTDLDRSGRSFHREGIQAAIAAVEAGQVDVLVVYDCSRLGRNTREALEAIERVRGAGGVFASVSEQIDDSPSGQMALTMYLGLAQLISDQMSVRWRDTNRRVFEQGRHHGPAPLGYRKAEGRPGEWDEDPVSAPAVREAFAMYAAGAVVLDVTRYLARTLGRTMHRDSVRKILANPVYLGLVHLHGETRPGRQPALIDEATWQRVQRQLAMARRVPKRRIATTWSMSGIAVCDLCSRRLVKHQVVRDGRLYQYLRCHPLAIDPEPVHCVGIGYARLELVEAEVRRQLLAYGRRLRDDVDERLAQQARKVTAKAAAAALRRELNALTATRKRTALDFAQREVTARERDDVYEQVDARTAEIDERLLELDTAVDLSTGRSSASLIARVDGRWDEMTAMEQRVALQLAGVREIRVRPPSIRRSQVQALVMDGRVEVLFF